MKAFNIILQGLLTEIYSLVNHHRVSKDLWEKVQLFMQGTSLTKQERKCKLYDAFDKFAHIKGELLHQYYLRFTQQINDMHIYNMKLNQFQVNTKFLNGLLPEWSKFVTDVKLVKDLHTTKFDQLYAYLKRYELHANEGKVIWQDSAQSQKGKGMPRGSGKKFYWSKLKEMVKFSLRKNWNSWQTQNAYDSDCNGISTAKAVLMANLSSYGSDVLSEIRPLLYDGNVIAKETNVISIADYEETLMLEEKSRSKMFLKQNDSIVLEKKFNTKPIDYAEFNRLSEDFDKCFHNENCLMNKLYTLLLTNLVKPA
nr:retrotransposon protein, putative, unclassified [Tanacetum cinerariifolium]